MVYKNWSCLLHSFFYLFFAFVLDWIVRGRACSGVCVCVCVCMFVYQLTRSLRTSSSTVARESISTLIKEAFAYIARVTLNTLKFFYRCYDYET